MKYRGLLKVSSSQTERYRLISRENVTGARTVDEIVDTIIPRITFRLVLLFTVASLYGYVCNIQTYITVFAGYIPYTSWVCTSEHCEDILKNNLYTRLTLCNVDYNLTHGTDFEWNTNSRTSFALALGFYCGDEYKVSMISSMFFVAGFFGLLISTSVFDKFGRKPGTIVFGVIGFLATLSGMFCNSYWSLLVMRFFQGLGRTVCWTGLYCWLLEFAPENLRNLFNSIILMTTSFGFLALALISYLCEEWHQMFFVASIMVLVTLIPLCFLPESPRFLLVTGKEKKAIEILKLYSRIVGNPISFDKVELVYSVVEKESFWGQLKSFIHFPYMTKQVILIMVNWFVTSTIFYGFNFSWSKITPNVSLGYVFAGIGDAVSCLWLIPITEYLGRKRSMMFFLAAAGVSFCVATINFKIVGSWTVELVSSLAGFMFTNSAYASNYLYTAEIAPTSHRGTILCLCSGAGRLGSYIGPYTNLLFGAVGNRITLCLFAGATLLALGAIRFTSDPTNKPIPETPEDMSRDCRGGSRLT